MCAYDLGREFHARDFQIDARLAQQNSFTKRVAVIPFGLLLSNLIIALYSVCDNDKCVILSYPLLYAVKRVRWGGNVQE